MNKAPAFLRYRKALFRLTLYVCALLAAFYLIAPFLWLVMSSFMYEREAISVPPHWIPDTPTLDHYYAYLFPSKTEANVGAAVARVYRYGLANSFIIATSVTLINLLLGPLAAYSLARVQFRGGQFLLLFYLGSRSVPAVAILIPFFILMKTYNLLDTHIAVILAHTTFTLPFTIWILKGYFQTIPPELERAARVDGCNRAQAFIRVVMPVAVPGLVAAGIFSFMLSWGEFLFALLFTSTIKTKTVTVLASSFTSDVGAEFTLIAAGGVLAVLPPLLLILVFQRFVVQGLVGGAVKG